MLPKRSIHFLCSAIISCLCCSQFCCIDSGYCELRTNEQNGRDGSERGCDVTGPQKALPSNPTCPCWAATGWTGSPWSLSADQGQGQKGILEGASQKGRRNPPGGSHPLSPAPSLSQFPNVSGLKSGCIGGNTHLNLQKHQNETHACLCI